MFLEAPFVVRPWSALQKPYFPMATRGVGIHSKCLDIGVKHAIMKFG